jgi:hypothetical protein
LCARGIYPGPGIMQLEVYVHALCAFL